MLKPTLEAVQPLTNGLANGITDSAGQLDTGINQVGKALNSATTGIGSIVQGALKGVGNTLNSLPKTLYALLRNIETSHTIITNILNVIL